VPVFAMVWGALLVGESISLIDVFGASLVLVSVALVFEKLRWPFGARTAAAAPIRAPAVAGAQPRVGATR
jgi:hypothetical protein